MLQNQENNITVDVLVDELKSEVINPLHHVLLSHIDHRQGSLNGLEFDNIAGYEAGKRNQNDYVYLFGLFTDS